MEYFSGGQRWSSSSPSSLSGTLLLTVLLIWLAYIAVGLVDKFVVTPVRIKRIMNRQGVKGPQALWLLGNMPDVLRLQRAEAEKDMKTGDYDTLSHILPFHTRSCQAYGERVFLLFSPPFQIHFSVFLRASFLLCTFGWCSKLCFLGLYFLFLFKFFYLVALCISEKSPLGRTLTLNFNYFSLLMCLLSRLMHLFFRQENPTTHASFCIYDFPLGCLPISVYLTLSCHNCAHMIDGDWKFFFIMINNHIVTLRQDIKSKCSDFSSVSKMLPLLCQIRSSSSRFSWAFWIDWFPHKSLTHVV